MARKRKKKLKNSVPVQRSYRPEELLEELLRCNTCTNGFSVPKFEKELDEYEWLIKNLPTLPYVKSQYVNFLFSNGLTTGDKQQDEKLDNFLYKMNIKGQTNFDVIQQAIILSKYYGRCGIRWLSEKDGIILVPPSQYTVVTEDDTKYDGFKKVYCYAVSTDEEKPIKLSELSIDREEFEKSGKLISEEKDWFIVYPKDFINLRNDTGTWEGTSIFEGDKQRLLLLASVYSRLNYDIEYDGPGRLLFFLKDNILNSGTTDISASNLLDQTAGTTEDRAERARKEIEGLAREIKNSTSDATILVSNIFKSFEHLPRVTKATEFFDWLMSREGSIIAQNFAITPELIGLGDVSGNVSMEKILDNGMVNNIVPEREKIATQFSPMLSEKLGLRKIYFDKYELKQQLDKSAEIYKEMLSVAQCVAMGTVEGDTMALAIMNHAMSTLGENVEFDIHKPLSRYSQEELEQRNKNISERVDKSVTKVEEVDVGKIR